MPPRRRRLPTAQTQVSPCRSASIPSYPDYSDPLGYNGKATSDQFLTTVVMDALQDRVKYQHEIVTRRRTATGIAKADDCHEIGNRCKTASQRHGPKERAADRTLTMLSGEGFTLGYWHRSSASLEEVSPCLQQVFNGHDGNQAPVSVCATCQAEAQLKCA